MIQEKGISVGGRVNFIGASRRCGRGVVLMEKRNRSLSDPHREHGHRAPVEPFDGETQALSFLSRPEHIEQGEIVVRCRYGELRVRPPPTVIEKVPLLTGLKQVPDLRLESRRPAVDLRVRVVPVVGADVVDEITAPQEKNSLVPQGGEEPSYLVMKGR